MKKIIFLLPFLAVVLLSCTPPLFRKKSPPVSLQISRQKPSSSASNVALDSNIYFEINKKSEIKLPALNVTIDEEGKWTLSGDMNTARERQVAVRLLDNQVLVAGGYYSLAILSACELYDPTTKAWMATDSLIGSREFHTATLLANGLSYTKKRGWKLAY